MCIITGQQLSSRAQLATGSTVISAWQVLHVHCSASAIRLYSASLSSYECDPTQKLAHKLCAKELQHSYIRSLLAAELTDLQFQQQNSIIAWRSHLLGSGSSE